MNLQSVKAGFSGGSRAQIYYSRLLASLEASCGEQDSAQMQARRDLARSNLLAFTEFTKPDYQASAHHRLIAAYLERVERGEIDRLMIFMPPQHGKSELATRRFPAWFLGRNPRKRVISASYNAAFAADFGRDVRGILDDDPYRELWNIRLRQDSKSANRWHTDAGGQYISAGIGTGITGRGADLGLIDDPFKDRAEAESPLIRESVWQWYTSTFYTRLAPWAPIVLTLTRWHKNDLAGRLMEEMNSGGDQWTILCLAALATGPDELGRVEGEPLWPERYNLPALERIKGVLARSAKFDWDSLYQQSPVTPGGNIFKTEWWKYYHKVPFPPSFKCQSWDTAFKTAADNDFNVCTTWGTVQPDFFLLDRYKEKLEFPELKRAVVQQAEFHQPHAVLVEDKASGQSLLQELQRETRLPLVAVKVDNQSERSKEGRAVAVTPLVQGGRVYLPEWASWVQDYVAVMAEFPNGAHDDDVDSTSQALRYLSTGPPSMFAGCDLS